MIILDLQNEYYLRRSSLPELSAFSFYTREIPNLVSNSIFRAIFNINVAQPNFIYTFELISANSLTDPGLLTLLTQTSQDIYVASPNANNNLLNLTTNDIAFIQACIQSNPLPPLISTTKDWLQASYVLWQLDKGQSLTIDSFNISCTSNLCKLVQLILNLAYIGKTCIINS